MKSKSYLEQRLRHLEDKLGRLTASHQPAPETVMEILRLEGRIKELKWILEP